MSEFGYEWELAKACGHVANALGDLVDLLPADVQRATCAALDGTGRLLLEVELRMGAESVARLVLVRRIGMRKVLATVKLPIAGAAPQAEGGT